MRFFAHHDSWHTALDSVNIFAVFHLQRFIVGHIALIPRIKEEGRRKVGTNIKLCQLVIREKQRKHLNFEGQQFGKGGAVKKKELSITHSFFVCSTILIYVLS